jgi:hypothetical protein
LNNSERQQLNMHLRDKWSVYKKGECPAAWTSSKIKKEYIPEVYIANPNDSIVLECLAFSINVTDDYPSGFTLRYVHYIIHPIA